jgi:hypothetical protein
MLPQANYQCQSKLRASQSNCFSIFHPLIYSLINTNIKEKGEKPNKKGFSGHCRLSNNRYLFSQSDREFTDSWPLGYAY